MCNPVAIIGGALTALSTMSGSRSSGNVQSYTPEEKELTVEAPNPPTQEPTFGVDNTDDAAKQAQKGRSVFRIDRNPGVAASGTKSGVTVPAG